MNSISRSISSSDSVQKNSRGVAENLFYILLNALVVGTVNALYIVSTTQERTSTQQFLIRLSLAAFNSTWSSLCLPLLSFSRLSRKVKLFVIAINTIFIPCIVTALTSPSCYQVFLLFSKLTHSLSGINYSTG
jgi:hypothetical protein